MLGHDKLLNFKTHINEILKSCYFHLWNITKIKSVLSHSDLEKVIHAFVFSRLDYCNALYTCLSQTLVTRLQLVQNTAARILTNTNRRAHITPILASLHWLPVKFRIDFKILLITFKAQHGLAPTYISQLLTPCNISRNLRSASLSLLAVPRSRLATQGDRAFSVRAPRLWNSLLDEIRLANSIPIFKSLLKTYFYRKAFLTCNL